MWDNEVEARVNAHPAEVWVLMEDPSTWSSWDPEVTDASIDGPMRVGATIRIDPTSGPRRTMSVVECEPGHRYCSEDRLPMVRLRFCHEVTSAGDGAHIRLTQRIDGPLAWLLARVLGSRIATRQAEAIKGLAAAAEHGVRRNPEPPPLPG